MTVPVLACTIFVKLWDGFSGMETPSDDAVSIVDCIVSSSFSHPEDCLASSFFFAFCASLCSAFFVASAKVLWYLAVSSWATEEFEAMSATD